MGYPVRTVKLTPPPELKMDVAAAARQPPRAAGWCSSATRTTRSRPPSTARRTREFVAALGKSSPNTTTLVDEAYFEYATMPGYETMIPLADREPARRRGAHVLEGVRHGRPPHRLRHRSHGLDQASCADWDGDGAVNVLGLSAARAALTQSPDDPQGREQAQHRRARVHDEVVQGSRLHADRFADQLHVRGHQASGARLPRRLREAGHPRRPRLPALREDALPHLHRHDGGDAEGGEGVRAGAGAAGAAAA